MISIHESPATLDVLRLVIMLLFQMNFNPRESCDSRLIHYGLDVGMSKISIHESPATLDFIKGHAAGDSE